MSWLSDFILERWSECCLFCFWNQILNKQNIKILKLFPWLLKLWVAASIAEISMQDVRISLRGVLWGRDQTPVTEGMVNSFLEQQQTQTVSLLPAFSPFVRILLYIDIMSWGGNLGYMSCVLILHRNPSSLIILFPSLPKISSSKLERELLQATGFMVMDMIEKPQNGGKGFKKHHLWAHLGERLRALHTQQPRKHHCVIPPRFSCQ